MHRHFHAELGIFWTRHEVESLDLAQDFHDLADIATDIILPRMVATRKQIVQLCGPISTGGLGSKNANIRRFQHAITVAKKNDLLVFDQMPFEQVIARLSKGHSDRGVYCEEILTIFYARVFGSGMVSKALFLPDWRTSKGSTWEREHLMQIGLPIEEFPDHWMEEVNRQCAEHQH